METVSYGNSEKISIQSGRIWLKIGDSWAEIPDQFNPDNPSHRAIAPHWQAYLSENGMPEIPPIVPEVLPPQADWARFRSQSISLAAFQAIAAAAPHYLWNRLENLLWRVEAEPGLIPEIGQVWGQIKTIAAPSVDQLADIKAIAESANLPAAFIELI